jgi:thermitase
MRVQAPPIQKAVRLTLPVLAALVIVLLLQQPALAQTPISQSNTVLVRFQPTLSAAERAATIAAMGGEEVAWLAQIHVAEVRLTTAGGGLDTQAVVTLADHPELIFAETDYAVSAMSIPNDPAFQNPAMHYALTRIQAPAAWDITLGSNDIIIAVVDSGVKLDHPAFAGRLTAGYDFVNQDEFADDDAGHGTHVAGIVAAAINDGSGMAGLCPACRIMPVKVLNAHSMGTWSNLAQGILFAADNGARVINLSLGSALPSQTLQAAIRYAQDQGALVVAAAGNHASAAAYYPAALDGVIAVAATNAHDQRWERSAYGHNISLVAPGDLIYSTYHDLDNIFGGYTYMSGTSMATPFVSALAGLVLSMAPSLDNASVLDALTLGADDLGT